MMIKHNLTAKIKQYTNLMKKKRGKVSDTIPKRFWRHFEIYSYDSAFEEMRTGVESCNEKISVYVYRTMHFNDMCFE